MSTRGMYTFIGEDGSFNVYQHSDNYPSDAARTLKTAIDWFAWQLPRYEADAFAAAFCAAGKVGWITTTDELMTWAKDHGPTGSYRVYSGGGVRLLPQGDPCMVAQNNCSDIEYRYEISIKLKKLHVRAFTGNWWAPSDKTDHPLNEEVIFDGSFDSFYAWAMKEGKAR